MTKHVALALLLVLSVAAVVALTQTSGTRALAAAEATPAAGASQVIVHGGHLLVLRGSMLNVYDLSGLPNARLVAAVVVPDSMDEAQAVLAAHTAAPPQGASSGGQSEDGKKVYASLDCAKCHRIAGKGGTVGPDLSHEGSRHNEEWIEKKITDPKATKKDSIMPAHKLPAAQLEALGKYLAGLK